MKPADRTARRTPQLRVETRGVEVVPAEARTGTAAGLFWPWCGATVSVLGVGFGAYALGYGVSVVQALAATVVGLVTSCLVCGVIAVAGARGSAPTLVVSRAVFGIAGNRLPAALCWVLTLGWDIVVTVVAVLATATVGARLGVGGSGRDLLLAGALILVVALVVGGAVLGYHAVLRLQRIVSGAALVLTAAFVALTWSHVDPDRLGRLPAGPPSAMVGATVLVMAGGGLGWVNAAADYSRYVPRTASGAAVAGWTTAGLATAPLLLIGYGVLLTASDPRLGAALARDPVGALAALLPTWFLVPFAVVTVLGQVGAALLGLYSSGLALLATGVPLTRPRAALVDGVLMVAATTYVVLGAGGDFLDQLRAFVITLGVPVSAWAGIMVVDVLTRPRYDEAGLGRTHGPYAGVRWPALVVLVVSSVVGLGLVTSPGADGLDWQGFLLGPLGGRDGSWADAGLGVVVALVLGAAGGRLSGRSEPAYAERVEVGG